MARELGEAREVVEQARREGTATHEVEEKLWQWALKTGWRLLELFFHLSGDGDAGPEWVDEQGQGWRRLEHKHARCYRSVFGEHVVERVVYGTREGQRIEAVPLDVRLQLPPGKYSYLLENWSQELATQLPFEEVARTLKRFLGQSVPVGCLERHIDRCVSFA